MKNVLLVILAIIFFWTLWFYYQEDTKVIGVYTVYYYANQCNPDYLPSSFSMLTQTSCVKKITWSEQIGRNLYQRMSWTPETGAKESGLERK